MADTRRAPGEPFSLELRTTLLIAAAIIAMVVAVDFLQQVTRVLLVFFAGCLLALLLDAGADTLRGWLKVSRRVAFVAFCVLLAAALVAIIWFAGDRIAAQSDQLARRLPEAWQNMMSTLREFSWVRGILDAMPDAAGEMDKAEVVDRAGQIITALLGGLGTALVILFVAGYLAWAPDIYRSCLLAIIPARGRERAREVLRVIEHALKRWLVGRLASMLIVAVLSALVLWLIGLPLAIALGLIAGLLSFIPYLGPILGAIPGVLIGLAESPQLGLHAALAYWGVQIVESYIVTPQVERRAVTIPPGFQIIVQIIGGMVAGILGIMLASPLLVIATILVQMLYIQDFLGESPDLPLVDGDRSG